MAGANDKPPDRLVRVGGGLDGEFLARRAAAFAAITMRRGMPLTWGTGKPRDDVAWKRDQKRRGKV